MTRSTHALVVGPRLLPCEPADMIAISPSLLLFCATMTGRNQWAMISMPRNALQLTRRELRGFSYKRDKKSNLTIDKSITRANKVVRNVRSGKESSRVTGTRSPTKGHAPFDPITSGREPMRVRRHNRRERESGSDDDEEKQGDDEEEEEPEVAIAPRRELADYDGSIERTIHFFIATDSWRANEQRQVRSALL